MFLRYRPAAPIIFLVSHSGCRRFPQSGDARFIPRAGWSAERSKKLGAAELDAILAVLGDLR